MPVGDALMMAACKNRRPGEGLLFQGCNSAARNFRMCFCTMSAGQAAYEPERELCRPLPVGKIFSKG
jgi:hypothetical protein